MLCFCVFSVIYLTATMTLGTISICLTVLVLNVHHRGARYPVPSWIKTLFLVYIGRIVCVRSRNPQKVHDKNYKKHEKILKTPEGNGVVDDMELLSLTVSSTTKPSNGPHSLAVANNTMSQTPAPEAPGDEPESEPDYSKDWHDLAHVMDRIFFWVLLICMTVSGVFILMYPNYMGILQSS